MCVSRARDYNRRNGMLKDELLLIAGFKHYRILVERSDTASQLHSTDQINRNIVAFLSCRGEEGILDVLLCRLCFYFADLLFRVRYCAKNSGRTIGSVLLPMGLYNTALYRAFQLRT